VKGRRETPIQQADGKLDQPGGQRRNQEKHRGDAPDFLTRDAVSHQEARVAAEQVEERGGECEAEECEQPKESEV